MTCVSTVSPRALDRIMAEVVPGASVLPTLIRPGDTHTGNGALDDWLAVIKIVRATSTAAANGSALAHRQVPRPFPPLLRVNLFSIFIAFFLPATIFQPCQS